MMTVVIASAGFVEIGHSLRYLRWRGSQVLQSGGDMRQNVVECRVDDVRVKRVWCFTVADGKPWLPQLHTTTCLYN